MSEQPISVTELERRMRPWVDDHTRRYLESGGVDGHVLDMSELGGHAYTPTLLLRHVGRKSGAVRFAPLIYGTIGGEVVFIASRGGADLHPQWYLNLLGSRDVQFQVGTQAFAGVWREVLGEERAALWAFMRQVYPPYDEYQARTDRVIPVVAITPGSPVPVFEG